MYRFVILFLISFFLISCNGNKKTDNKNNSGYIGLKTGKLYNSIKIKADTSQSYDLYLPLNYNENKKNKVIFFFDPHAKGYLPINKYKDLSEKYNVVIVASNNSHNGMSASRRNDVITKFMVDVEQRFNVDNKHIITAGQSGGARIAALIGLYNKNVTGIIECGAGFPGVQNINNTCFTWVGIAGNTDFNFLEMKKLYSQLISNKYKAYFLTFDGKHEWPPKNVMDEALRILLRNDINNLKYQIKENPETSKWEKAEIKEQNLLLKSFDDKDISWWNNMLTKLKTKSKNAPTEDERLMNARLLSYLGIMAYAYTGNALKYHKLEKANKYLQIYESVEPKNGDMFYYKAVYMASIGKDNIALKALEKAVDNGFTDFSKIKNQKVFVNLKNNETFQKIISGRYSLSHNNVSPN